MLSEIYLAKIKVMGKCMVVMCKEKEKAMTVVWTERMRRRGGKLEIRFTFGFKFQLIFRQTGLQRSGSNGRTGKPYFQQQNIT